MDADGGKARNPSNKIGAKYGAGYCDSQCPRDLKWIGGKVCHEFSSYQLRRMCGRALNPLMPAG